MEELSEILLSQFPDLWKLSQAYLRRELLPSEYVMSSNRFNECQVMVGPLISIVYNKRVICTVFNVCWDFILSNLQIEQ